MAPAVLLDPAEAEGVVEAACGGADGDRPQGLAVDRDRLVPAQVLVAGEVGVGPAPDQGPPSRTWNARGLARPTTETRGMCPKTSLRRAPAAAARSCSSQLRTSSGTVRLVMGKKTRCTPWTSAEYW